MRLIYSHWIKGLIMFRVTKMSGIFYAKEIINLENEDTIDDINIFVSESTPVILCMELEDLDVLGIDENDIVIA